MTEEINEEVLADTEQQEEEIQEEESAPSPAEDPGEEEPKKNRVQERINQLTKEKYAQARRVEELERQLKDLNRPKEPESLKPPKWEDFDYDDDRFNQANASYIQQLVAKEAGNALSSIKQREQAEAESKRQNDIVSSHMARVDEFMESHKDFSQVAANIPDLSDQAVLAIMSAENSPSIVYHLGKNLDLAEQIANSDSVTAARMIGRLEAQLSVTPPKKSTNAPDPVTPIKAGSAVDVDEDKLSTEEWIAQRNKAVRERSKR